MTFIRSAWCKNLLVSLLGLSLCTSAGCLALAAGAAGAGAGYMIGREHEEDDKPDEVHIHHDRGETPPNSVDVD